MSGSDGVKVFVYGVNGSCPKRILEDEFSRSGSVLDVFITGKGYAFVTMSGENDAKRAIKDLNGAIIDGQEVKVEMAHGKRTSGSRGGGRGGRGMDGRRGRGGPRYGSGRGEGSGGFR